MRAQPTTALEVIHVYAKTRRDRPMNRKARTNKAVTPILVRYTTDDVEVSANGASANDLQAMQVGMRVGVVFPSSSDDGSDQLSVSHLYYESDIEGVVTAIDRSQNLLSVAGVQVHYNDLTRFLGTSAATLAVGQRVEVSGHFAAELPFLSNLASISTRRLKICGIVQRSKK